MSKSRDLGEFPAAALDIDAAGNVSVTGDISLADNDKLLLGTGSDLQIYHDGSDSYIKDNGTGYLKLLGTGSVEIGHPSNGHNYIRANYGGDVELYFSNAEKLSTTSTGINVTGTITADGLTVETTADNGAVISAHDNVTTTYPLKVQNAAGSGRLELGTYGINNNIDLKLQTQDKTRIIIDTNGDVSFNEDTGTTPKFFWDASTERLGIGTSSPSKPLTVYDASTNRPALIQSGDADSLIEFKDNSTSYAPAVGATGNDIIIQTGAAALERLRIDSAGNVGIGVVPKTGGSTWQHVQFGGTGNLIARKADSTVDSMFANNYYVNSSGVDSYITTGAAARMFFNDSTISFDQAASGATDAAISWSEAMRIESSGNLLVGKGSTTESVEGIELRADGWFKAIRSSAYAATFRRNDTDGTIVEFLANSNTAGSVGIQSYGFEINGESGHTGISFATTAWVPLKSGSRSNDEVDLGVSSYRFDDVYATNGTISTSDRNEKQDILEITEAEAAVAKACKGLLRSFRWKSAVKKSEDARVHFGIMAQDLQGAFTAEGLDAGRYGMFISSTWWEAQTEVAAVEAVEGVEFVQAVEASEALYSEDGELISEAVEAVEGVEGVEAVEAKDAYTRTDTFDTLAEAPEGATERTLLGVRYTELLAFIIAAI